MSDREDFEKACPVPEGVYWDPWSDNDGQYEAVSPEHEELADIQQARLQGWIAARAQQGEGRAIGEIDEGEEGVFVELYPDNTFTIGQKVYTHPPKAQGVPEGWKFERESGDRITIDADGLGFYVARMDAERIADIMLYALAQDLLPSEPGMGGEK